MVAYRKRRTFFRIMSKRRSTRNYEYFQNPVICSLTSLLNENLKEIISHTVSGGY